MDPLVRVALSAQQWLGRSFGILLGAGFGAYLIYWAAAALPDELNYVVCALLVASTLLRASRRLRRITLRERAQLDAELFVHLVVAAYAIVLHAPGDLDGAYYPVLYALMMLVATFARPSAAVVTVAFAIGLEAALGHWALDRPTEALAPHAALLAAFAVLNLAVFRAEIARVRRLSRAHLEREMQRMKDDARSYRLIGAPTSAVEPASSPHATAHGGDADRLLRASVDEIRESLRFSLKLLRRSLRLQTAALLWLDGSDRLVVREIVSQGDDFERGPFGANEGLFAAAFETRGPVSLSGPRARAVVPYYTMTPTIDAVCAVPVLDHGNARGLLVVDRDEDGDFSESEEEFLREVTRYVLRAIENERVFVQLERAKVEQGKLYRAVDQLSAATTEAGVIEAGVSSAREFAAFDFAVVTLFQRKGSKGVHEICAASGEGAEDLVGQRFLHNKGLVSMVVANRHPLPYRGNYDPDRQSVFTRHIRPPDMPSLVVLPLVVHESVLGTLILGSNERGAFGDDVRPTLEVLSRHIAVSLANARMVKRLEDLATTDGMTGLFNKRALTEFARQKIRSAERFDKPLSLLVCDIDHFKKVNDTYGHDVGDVVIRGFGEVLKRAKRETDVVGRFGGEEFALVCEETGDEGATLLGERIRQELEATTFHSQDGTLNVTCSVGVATFPRAGKTWEAIFKSTDEALYEAKRSGRNRVVLWSRRHRGAQKSEPGTKRKRPVKKTRAEQLRLDIAAEG